MKARLLFWEWSFNKRNLPDIFTYDLPTACKKLDQQLELFSMSLSIKENIFVKKLFLTPKDNLCRPSNRAFLWTKGMRTVKRYYFNPFAPRNFAENHHVLMVVEFFLISVSLQIRAQIFHKAVHRSCTTRPSDPDAKF